MVQAARGEIGSDQRAAVRPRGPGLGIPPMTLDLDAICISGVPITGIGAISAVSARQFFLGNREFVRLACLDDEFSAVSFADAARNRAAEMTMAEPVD